MLIAPPMKVIKLLILTFFSFTNATGKNIRGVKNIMIILQYNLQYILKRSLFMINTKLVSLKYNRKIL